MLTDFASAKPLVGLKQSRKAVADGTAECAYIAKNADPAITEPFATLCEEKGIKTVWAETMEELGHACGINVGAAVAVLTKQHTDNI